jgi:hypothetical protein
LPNLDTHYPVITAVPINIRLQRNNKHLREWIDRVNHQIHMTDALCACQQGQLTLQEAYEQSNIRQHTWRNSKSIADA